ncbi:hypothetical protein Hdeb2414_s0001g00031741 [Helianthus debilis subsp. tardiflorus]
MSHDHYFDVVIEVVGLVIDVLSDRFYCWIDQVYGSTMKTI